MTIRTDEDSANPAAFAGDTEAERTSDVLARFRHHLPADRVSLADLMEALADRSLGTILLLLSIPTVAPVPLGVSVLFNLPILLFSLRLAFGRHEPRLPGWLLRRTTARDTAVRMIDAALPRVRGIENMLKPRLARLAGIDRQRGFGVLCLILAAIAFVPLPLTGWLPGFALVFLALGLVERDGVAVAVGLGFAAAAMVFMGGVLGGMAYAGWELLDLGAP
jgi:hypothetical protein